MVFLVLRKRHIGLETTQNMLQLGCDSESLRFVWPNATVVIATQACDFKVVIANRERFVIAIAWVTKVRRDSEKGVSRRKGVLRGVSRRCLERPLREYDPLGVRPI